MKSPGNTSPCPGRCQRSNAQSGDAAAAQLHLGLVEQDEFVVLDGLANGLFQFDLGQRFGIHLRGEEAEGVAARLLGPVHRGIRVLEQGLWIGCIVGMDGDADARGHGHIVTFQVERFAQRLADLAGGDGGCVLAVLHRQDQGKLIATEAPDGIPRMHALDQSAAELAQQFIADRVGQRVVHVLEMVEVDEQDGDHQAAVRRLFQGLCEGFVEQCAIWQAGDGVVVRQMLEVGRAPALPVRASSCGS